MKIHSSLVVSLLYQSIWLSSSLVLAFNVPSSPPSSAVTVDPALLGVSIEFFAFPGYTELAGTTNCLAHIEDLRGTAPAVRIGGTTQDRATYDPNLSTAVNYTVSDPSDAPESLTFGNEFFVLASGLKGDVTIGLNRQLNNVSNSLAAASEAEKTVGGLLAIEFGNEPDLYSQDSPIVPSGETWSPSVDGQVQKEWIADMGPTLGEVVQAAVYLSYPTWSTAGLIPTLGDALDYVKTFSGHSYPQSACGGANTDLQSLMSHSEIVNYTAQYASDAQAAHNQSKVYFLGETNSATCGGGGISPTFGAALWVIDYSLQAALNGIDRLYYHQGTLGNCAYCFWGNNSVAAPFYGAAFLSEFLGSDGTTLAELDDGSSAISAYAVYAGSTPTRLLAINSNYYNGSGTRTNATVTFSGLSTSGTVTVKRLTAASAGTTSGVTIGSGGSFDADCVATGEQSLESVGGDAGTFEVELRESEAIIVYT